jgi:hypothetical protein
MLSLPTTAPAEIMAIYRLLQNTAFGPDLIQEMTKAYEEACTKLGLTEMRTDPLTELVARTIIEFAQSGVKDSKTLCELTLGKLLAEGASRVSEPK